MIGSTRAVRVLARAKPTDLRNGFDGLYGLVRNDLLHDPLDGSLYLFVNKRRKSAKILMWDGTGLCVYSKRLSRGCFACLWDQPPGEPVQLTHAELSLFLEGATLAKRFSKSPPEIRL